MQGGFAYNVVLHLHHKTFSYENQYAALSHTIRYIQTIYIYVSYEFSTYTDSFSRELGNWAIPTLSSLQKVNTTSLNVFKKMKHVNYTTSFRHVHLLE